MTLDDQLWRTPDRTRQFIILDAAGPSSGTLKLVSLAGDEIAVDPEWAVRFEVTEAEARAWAQEEFGFVLGLLRRRIDAKLARARASLDAAKTAPVAAHSAIAPDAVPATWELISKMPRAILNALSGDPALVALASEALLESEKRLGKAGVDVAPGLRSFADRLAALRRDFDAARATDSG